MELLKIDVKPSDDNFFKFTKDYIIFKSFRSNISFSLHVLKVFSGPSIP